MTFSNILGVTEILCSFRLVLEVKTNNKISESSRLEFLQKLLTKTTLLYQMEQTTPLTVE